MTTETKYIKDIWVQESTISGNGRSSENYSHWQWVTRSLQGLFKIKKNSALWCLFQRQNNYSQNTKRQVLRLQLKIRTLWIVIFAIALVFWNNFDLTAKKDVFPIHLSSVTCDNCFSTLSMLFIAKSIQNQRYWT